ncbi:hypothetical protein V6N13_106201 [Hibiscus sabdariffa]|uniref:Amino acid transporter transmembrane domain-containing protein n=1 Tax=Hibiscus sabdariffa TaxID=183260 RepID=A0ABR2F006_9ROSI
MFYLSCGLLGYAAFGKNPPGNLLTGFGFTKVYWLIDDAKHCNMCIAVHLVVAYQAFMVNSLCDHDNCGGNASPILQRCCRPAQCRFVLATDRVFPDPNADIKRKHSTLLLDMDMVRRLDHDFLDNIIGSCSGWVHCYNA